MNTPNNAISVPQEAQLPSFAATMRHYELVQQILQGIMKENVHYGQAFPGDKKKNLLKPGADALMLAFRLVPEFTIDERDLGGDHRGYTVSCRMLTQSTSTLVATGVGSCSTKEGKYRYRNAKPACPLCGNIGSVIKTKRGFWCPEDKGGCGGNPTEEQMRGQPAAGKVENPDPADCWNTVLKIAKKRAMVDAAITACAASDLFTQDIEDIRETIDAEVERHPTQAAKPPVSSAPAAAQETRSEHTQEKPAARTSSSSTTVAKPATSTPTQATSPTSTDGDPNGTEAKNEARKAYGELKELHEGWSKIAWAAKIVTVRERTANLRKVFAKIQDLLKLLGDGGWEDIDHIASTAGEKFTNEEAAIVVTNLLAYNPTVSP
jgi:hypothetical protein